MRVDAETSAPRDAQDTRARRCGEGTVVALATFRHIAFSTSRACQLRPIVGFSRPAIFQGEGSAGRGPWPSLAAVRKAPGGGSIFNSLFNAPARGKFRVSARGIRDRDVTISEVARGLGEDRWRLAAVRRGRPGEEFRELGHGRRPEVVERQRPSDAGRDMAEAVGRLAASIGAIARVAAPRQERRFAPETVHFVQFFAHAPTNSAWAAF